MGEGYKEIPSVINEKWQNKDLKKNALINKYCKEWAITHTLAPPKWTEKLDGAGHSQKHY